MMRLIYNVFMLIGIVGTSPLIASIVLSSDKHRKTFWRRLGFQQELGKAKTKEQGRPTIWVHALSVGEVISAVPLVKALREKREPPKIAFSTSTKTGFEIANTLFKEIADYIFFFPYDVIFAVKHIRRKVNPQAVILVETDIWPNFLFEMQKWNVPVLLVNGRLSDRSFRGYRRISFFSAPVFALLKRVCAQSAEDGRRFERLGVASDRIVVTGNLKFDQEIESISPEELEKLRQTAGIHPEQEVIVAGSTHDGEERILLDVFSKLKMQFSDLLLVVVPRDPKRALTVHRLFQAAGFSTVFIEEAKRPVVGERRDIIVVDTIGMLRKLYAICDLAFVGGSMVPLGGHNPLEPAAFSKPVLFGSDMSNFSIIAKLLLESDGAAQVRNAGEFNQTASRLLRDMTVRDQMGRRAFGVFRSNRGAVERVVQEVERFLE
jgi:3-deoxy-D-manno-octulosonic-acid transferase